MVFCYSRLNGLKPWVLSHLCLNERMRDYLVAKEKLLINFFPGKKSSKMPGTISLAAWLVECKHEDAGGIFAMRMLVESLPGSESTAEVNEAKRWDRHRFQKTSLSPWV